MKAIDKVRCMTKEIKEMGWQRTFLACRLIEKPIRRFVDGRLKGCFSKTD
jgi:hypothetical protein